MSYPTFDLSRLDPHSWSEIGASPKNIPPLSVSADLHSPTIQSLGEELVKARNQGGATVFLCDADTITHAVSRDLIDMISRGLVTHVALELSAARKDWQFAWSDQHGSKAEESAEKLEFRWLNELETHAALPRSSYFSAGEFVGQRLFESEAPFKDDSVLAQGYRWGVPVTIHNSYLPEPPCALELLTREIDFLVLANSIENLDQGLVYQFGQPTMPLEAFMVALEIARSIAARYGRTIDDFTATSFTDSTVAGSVKGVHQTLSVERSFSVQGNARDAISSMRQAALSFAGWNE